MASPNSCVETLAPLVMVFDSEAFERSVGLEEVRKVESFDGVILLKEAPERELATNRKRALNQTVTWGSGLREL